MLDLRVIYNKVCGTHYTAVTVGPSQSHETANLSACQAIVAWNN